MQITAITNTINTTKQYNTNKSNNLASTPNFTGFWDFLPKKNSLRYVKLDSDITIFSPKELKKLRENVANEIREIIKMPATPGLKKRLNDLLYSPFADYKTDYFDGMSNLSNLISYNCERGKGTDLYRQFVTTSIAETMPIELLKGKEFKGIAHREGNQPLRYVLDSYHKMNESTPEASAIRKMVKRLNEAGIDISDNKYYLAHSLVNDQPLMSKTLIDAFEIKPNDYISVITEKATRTDSNFKKQIEKFDNPQLLTNPATGEKFFIANPEILKNKGEGTYSFYVFNSETMPLYNLAGLSKNKEVKNLFDVFKITDFNPRKCFSNDNTNTLEEFLRKCKPFHPEMDSLEFIEKYIKTYNYQNNEINYILSPYPLPNDYKNLNIEVENKIKMLNQIPSEENKKELDLLRKIQAYINR